MSKEKLAAEIQFDLVNRLIRHIQHRFKNNEATFSTRGAGMSA